MSKETMKPDSRAKKIETMSKGELIEEAVRINDVALGLDADTKEDFYRNFEELKMLLTFQPELYTLEVKDGHALIRERGKGIIFATRDKGEIQELKDLDLREL